MLMEVFHCAASLVNFLIILVEMDFYLIVMKGKNNSGQARVRHGLINPTGDFNKETCLIFIFLK